MVNDCNCTLVGLAVSDTAVRLNRALVSARDRVTFTHLEMLRTAHQCLDSGSDSYHESTDTTFGDYRTRQSGRAPLWHRGLVFRLAVLVLDVASGFGTHGTVVAIVSQKPAIDGIASVGALIGASAKFTACASTAM